MNNKGLSLAVFFGFALLLIAGFIYLSIFQASKTFRNQEPERPAFEIIRANTELKTTQVYLQQAAQYSISHAIITLTSTPIPTCTVLTNKNSQYSLLNSKCFSLPLLAEQLKTLFSKEFSKYLTSHNERTKKQGIYIPEKHIYTIFNTEKILTANAIAIDNARIPVISPAQDNHPESIYYKGYNIYFPATNLIPAYLDYTAEDELSYKRIGYLYYKPSATAEIQFSLNAFLEAYKKAEQIIVQCVFAETKKGGGKNKEVAPSEEPAIDTGQCLEENKPKDWIVSSTATHSFFTVPLGEIDGKIIEFRFGVLL